MPNIPPSTPELPNHQYRSDIDGLRAFAVLSVVLFHAFPEWISGGFIGVDVFFVISGFLISTIIFEKLEQGSFSFTDFYARRVRRIFPALILVLVTSFVLGWCILFVSEYKQLGKHIAGGAGFVANLILWSESSYFDNLSDTKPLLHLWSLGIEEQFYIVWPPILWSAWRFGLRSILPIIVLIALASFALNLYSIALDPVATFYSPLTRFWELLIGSLLAYVTVFSNKHPKFSNLSAQKANVYSWMGCGLFTAGLLLINKESSFPGGWALLPTLGAALMIQAGSSAWFNRVVLGNPVLVRFGLISYPLYLWHWPLLSFSRILSSGVPELEIRIGVVALSILLSWLTYRFVEKPIRFGNGIQFNIPFFSKWFVSKKAITIALVVGLCLIGFAGFLANYKNGSHSRLVNKINIDPESGYDGVAGVDLIEDCGLANSPTIDKAWFGACLRDSRPPVKYALVGDSHAASLFRGLVRTSNESGRWLFIGGPGGKGAVSGVISGNPLFQRFMPNSEYAINSIAKNKDIEVVLIANATRNVFGLNEKKFLDDLESSPNFDVAYEAVQNAINPLKAAGKKVVILEDNPTLGFPEDCLQRKSTIAAINYFFPKELNPRCVLTIEQHAKRTEQYTRLLAMLEKNNPGTVSIFYTTPILCDESKGLCEISKNGRLLYSYSDHISDYSAGLIGRPLNNWLREQQVSNTQKRW
jgi:peptidoglycan/LPS O-acetylase OafA/YrhL